MTTPTPTVTERGRLTALRAAWLFDGTGSALIGDPLVVIDSRYLDELGGPDGLAGVAKQVIVSDDFLAQARDAEPAYRQLAGCRGHYRPTIRR